MRRASKFKLATLSMFAMGLLFLPSTISASYAQSTLQNLFEGASLVADDAVYFNFALTGDEGTISPDFSSVGVNIFSAFGETGLEFIGNGEFNLAPGIDSIIFGLEYDVIYTADQLFVRSDFSGGNPYVGEEGFININSQIFDGNLLAEVETELDPLFGINTPSATELLNTPSSSLQFQTSFSFFADANSSASLSSFRTSTSTVPEPSSLFLCGALAAPMLVRRRRSRQI